MIERAAPPEPTAPTEPIRRWALETPHAVAVVDRVGGGTWTYAALDAAATRWGAWLADRGVGAGDRVGVLAANRIEHVLLFTACLRLGAALVPLNWRLAEPELRAVVADARLRVLLVEGRWRALVEGAGPVADLESVVLPDAPPDAVPLPLEPTVPSMVLYTSGSTGRPKGAVLPVRQLAANAVATVHAWQLSRDDIGPVTTPFFHTGGWHVFATPLWWIGGTVVLAEAFDPDTWLPMLAEAGCTIAFAVPTQLAMVGERASFGIPLPRLRWCIAGGAPCPAALGARFAAAGYRLREGFGMTEFGPNCFGTTDAAAVAKPHSVGWPVPFAELRLVDADGRDVPDGTPGELWLRGPQRFAGYLFDDERSAQAITPDGWYRTGDVLVRDADGAYEVFGRLKEMFISGGENVFPGEVEAALVAHPAVAEAVVVAVPDPRWGEVGCAFVVPRTGTAPTEDELRGHARARLAGYKVPKRIVCLPELPRLGTGKADRRTLTARAAALHESSAASA